MFQANEIKSILSLSLPGQKKRYPISTMAIFGSYARGEATKTVTLILL